MNNVELKPRYDEAFSEYEKRRCLDFLPSLSEDMRFEDDIWICVKRIKSVHEMPADVSIYFTHTPAKHKVMAKYPHFPARVTM
jgi:aspartyl/asparaginyl beta-hydroxylase (cupin superfamily)